MFTGIRRVLTSVVVSLVLIGIMGCGKKEEVKKVDFNKRVEIPVKVEEEEIRIAVSAMISPKEIFSYYQQILDYIGDKLGRKVKLVQRKTYAEVNELMRKGELEAAFVCSGPYVEGKKEFGMELLVAPQSHGEAVYYSYIIVHKDSPIKSIEGLKGKTFAFTDPYSNTGKLVPTYELAKMGKTPDSYFAKYIFTHSHDNSIEAVAEKIVDGAAVDHLIFEYLKATNPKYTSLTKIVKKLGPFGMPPFVVRPGLSPLLKNQIKEILLKMHQDEKGKNILKGIFIDRFVVVDDHLYDSVRQMQDWLAKQE
ncbi:phosphate/phosphite/phosphonate ABC transporter substrate-binding protein [bacterium]|nr:phosphate/phosphite/phosphonate ABC transporter substrate-binding protein [bacterium]MBU2461446.1 phosphate/phosphite/phosphonate ABC transporter substrate-binding protein [bacterium]